MQRQRSILSFFQKPSSTQGLVSGNATSGGGDGGGSRFTVKEGDGKGDASVHSAVSKSVDEVKGTDTPPEKVPRRVLPSGFKAAESVAGSGASSLFTNIMHKFVMVDDRDCSGARSREHVVPLHDSSVCVKKDDNVFPEFRSNNGQSQERSHAFSFSGRNECDVALSALGELVNHLSRLKLEDVLKHGDIYPYQVYRGCLRIDGQTMVNLEIFNNSCDGGPSGTLYKYLDNCVSPTGKRLLRNWICHPLKDVVSINKRLDVVEELTANSEIIEITGQYLRKLPDLERLLGRIKSSVQSSTSVFPALLGKKVLKQRVKAFGQIVKGLRSGIDLLLALQKESNMMILLCKLCKLPVLVGKSGLELFLSQFEAAIDSDFPNYQNQDMTEENAETLTVLIELFIERATQWSEVIHTISCLDVLRSFAVTASLSAGSMARPVIFPDSNQNQEIPGPILKIQGLWHPFAVAADGQLPVPNDILLGEARNSSNSIHPRSLLLTGPNMGGKSTLLRATCLAVIFAQLGCYVPCETCELSLVDTIFTRLGASDRIMTGESTFLVECTETASVLQNATQNSLVILDELGRGTSTFDGYAIAYSVFRHLVEKVQCRMLFATHYHPLTKEFASHPRVTSKHMACAFKSRSDQELRGGCDQDLVFLYRLTEGACPESYGLQVALMAGIPNQVVETASDAAQAMKRSIGENFKSSELRSEFSSLHEEWLKTLVDISRTSHNDNTVVEDDHDMLVCLWHELKSSYCVAQVKADNLTPLSI
ncbi:PREDICTED: DNA mismatch repair protein MSH7 [Camelina sativa]|uniref:DNA mismatch repair protein MSH7 n=1 Tax=Camelina sativa TaxID=90675 RepID=A0ABM0XS04_CAMSA|nr:PREDICTED: DNA mismatch repair protein MSH7 [Camelina sativa]